MGLSAAAGQEMGAILQQCGLLGSLPSGGAQAAVLRIVGNACAGLTALPCGTGRTLEAAPQGAPSVFSLELAPGRRHTLAVFLSTALVHALQAESESESQEEPEPRGPIPVLLDLDLPVVISLGRARVPIRDLLRLSTGSVVELDRTVSEPVDITINDSVIARGEIVVVEGNYGVRIQTVFGTACRSVAGLPGSR